MKGYKEFIVSKCDLAGEKKGMEKNYITAFGAEKVANMPFCATGNNDLALDGGLAALTARAKQLMKIQVAVEPGNLCLSVRVMR